MVRIITDSAADFEPHELEQLNIACIPLKVMFGNDEYEENLTLSKDKFYELLLSGSDLPKTSQASPPDPAGSLRGSPGAGRGSHLYLPFLRIERYLPDRNDEPEYGGPRALPCL